MCKLWVVTTWILQTKPFLVFLFRKITKQFHRYIVQNPLRSKNGFLTGNLSEKLTWEQESLRSKENFRRMRTKSNSKSNFGCGYCQNMGFLNFVKILKGYGWDMTSQKILLLIYLKRETYFSPYLGRIMKITRKKINIHSNNFIFKLLEIGFVETLPKQEFK